jgi:hypothetical protein
LHVAQHEPRPDAALDETLDGGVDVVDDVAELSDAAEEVGDGCPVGRLIGGAVGESQQDLAQRVVGAQPLGGVDCPLEREDLVDAGADPALGEGGEDGGV